MSTQSPSRCDWQVPVVHWTTVVVALVLSVPSVASAQPPGGAREAIPAPAPVVQVEGSVENCRNCPIQGVDCRDGGCGELPWKARRPLPWQVFAQGEYVGPHRTAHVPVYRLRVDDEVVFVYRLTREVSGHPYRLNVGDEIRVESLQDENLDRDLMIQPDGTITLRLLGQIMAAGLTIDDLRKNLESLYHQYYKEPTITVTPIRVNTKLEDLRSTVDSRAGFGGQNFTTNVSPDGTVQLPAIGSIPAQGLTLDELKTEVDERYATIVDGIEVTPVLTERAPRFIFVVGEVTQPGRFDLTGPTTAMQAVALAGGWVNGGNLREIVVFRRASDWRLMATKLDLRAALYGKRPIPSDEIWLRDSDIVLVPKNPIRRATDAVDQVFGATNQIIPILTGLEILSVSNL